MGHSGGSIPDLLRPCLGLSPPNEVVLWSVCSRDERELVFQPVPSAVLSLQIA